MNNSWKQKRKNAKKNNLTLPAIKVTLVNQFFPPDYAATGQLLDQLTKLLVKKNIFFLILTVLPNYAFKKNYSISEKMKKNRRIIRFRNPFRGKNIKLKTINGLIFSVKIFLTLLKKENRGNLIIFTSEPPFLVFFINIIYLLFKTPYIYLIYDLYPDTLVNLNFLKKNNFIVRFWFSLNKYCFKNAKNIILLSELMKEKCLLNYGDGFQNKIKVIPSWSDINKIKPLIKEKNKFIKKYKLKGKFIVLYSGNQGRMHDFDTLLSAANYLKSDDQVIFLFIGDGPLNSKIKEFAQSNSLKNIKTLSYQPFEKLPETLPAADIAVVSTLENVTSLVAPSKLYGHLASATPVALISSKSSYIRFMIEKNNCGKWFANGNYKSLSKWIIKLKENSDLRKQISYSSRKLSEKISNPEDIAKKYFEVILDSIR